MLMHITVIIANLIHRFVEDWSEGDSYYLTINIDDLFVDDCKILEDKIDDILLNLDIVESFEIKCDELILEINMFILQQNFDQKMQDWKREEQIQNEEYMRSVIG